MFTTSGYTNFSANTETGFTLVEILIAISIFAIIITTIFGSHNFVFSSAKVVEEDLAAYEMAKSCLSRITDDFQSLHVCLPPEYTPLDSDDDEDPFKITGETADAGSGSFSRLMFASRAHVSLEKNIQEGIAQIAYYVQKSDESTYVLRRADKLYPYEPFEEKKSDPVLCENVKSLVFKYYDEEGGEYDAWDSDSTDVDYSTPRAIKITLEIGDDSSFLPFETMVKLPVFREKIERDL
ncbi:MAG: type II secretion system protein GspJ [Desulfobacterales bacterium]|nr:type II secretion system protein GspJ [Desulfobacterales bacterium]MDX2510247.1 type II secretion system protein GspJ [Desulfobacterales bacterium]